MTKSTIDFRTPAAGFDQPLALWQACHQRVLRMVGLLTRLVQHVDKFGADESARVTATSILRYFDEAAPRHHEDEELDLFPRLLAKAKGKEYEPVATTIASLRRDHHDLHELWTGLRETLKAIERGEAAPFDESSTASFVDRYRTHCDVEDDKLGPLLKRLLGADELAQIGRAMARRRGVDWDELVASR